MPKLISASARALLLSCLSLVAACTPNASTHSPTQPVSEQLAALELDAGELIYRGSVVPEGAQVAAFVYERRVEESGEAGVLRSTHLTFARGAELAESLDSAHLVVAQRAEHSTSYALRSFEQLHAQTGTVARVEVEDDGSLVFERERGHGIETRRERAGAPVVVGPTLFGFVRAHWDQLSAGESLAVRFATPERGRSYGFSLRTVATDELHTSVEFRATSPFVRAAIAPMRLVFNTHSGEIERYLGRVPPELEGAAFDAVVDYEFVAAVFR